MSSDQNGERFDIDSGIEAGAAGEAGTAPEPAPARPSVALDLRAWGRGEVQYPFGEVVKAIDDYVLGEIYKIIDARFVSLNSRADAIRFLVAEGIISSAEARTDV